MKELLAIIESCRAAPGEAGVLATLVRTEGSSYRRVGARLLWRPGGERLGSISGGCLEEDLLLRAAEVHRSGRGELVVYDTTSENDLVWGVGLGCHGVVRLTLERVVGLPLPYARLQAAWERRRPAVLATAFSGNAGEAAGLKVNSAVFLMEKGGEMWSSGSVDAASAAEAAERCFTSGSNHYTEAQIEGAGRVDILWEYLPPPMTLHIFGAGDDAQPLCRLARELGWRVFVRDPRAAFATAARFPGATHVSAYTGEAPDLGAIDPWSAVVIMSHHYRFDLPLLPKILGTSAPYIGLLGPRKRAEKILEELEAAGNKWTEGDLARLHAPVGLDLGAGSPEQVALSVLAEIEATRNRRDARPLRERTRPIHG